MAKHAILSASGASRWLTCTPSARLELPYSNASSSYAEEGTAAHEVAELETQRLLGAIDNSTYEKRMSELREGKYYNAEMQESAVAYAEFVKQKYSEAKASCPDALVELETRLDFSRWVPDGFGTGDCIIIADGVMDVIDFKYGKGHRVDAEDNPQMRLYGLGALVRFGLLYDIDVVRMSIFQPRLTHGTSTEEMSHADMIHWAETFVAPRAKLAYDGTGEFVPTEEACRFCRAGADCKARADKLLSLFDEALDPNLATLEEIGAFLTKAADLQSWVNALKERINTALLSGESCTGWKLVEGRSNRKFSDPDAVAKAFKKAGLKQVEIFEKKMKPLTQFEKDLGKKRVGEILGDLVIKPQGAPTLAPESDKRPAFVPADEVLKAFDET